MTIWVITIAVAIYFILGALLALKYFREEGKYDPPLECFGAMAVVFVLGVALFAYLALRHVTIRLIRWGKNRGASR